MFSNTRSTPIDGAKYLVFLETAGPIPGGLCYRTRNYDVAINFWRGQLGSEPFDAEYVFYDPDYKLYAAHTLLAGIWRNYDAILFLDDDVEMSVETINALFTEGHARGLEMWQPALSHRSCNCWPHLGKQTSRICRPGRFCELMSTFFSRAALEKCWDTFAMNESGWGLHIVWPMVLDRNKIGIFDGLVADHLRPLRQPVGGAVMRLSGKTQRQEDNEMKAKYDVPPVNQPGYFTDA